MQPTETIFIREASDEDRRRVRMVFNSDKFRGRFGVTGSTQEQYVFVHYTAGEVNFIVNFTVFFTELFNDITRALLTL